MEEKSNVGSYLLFKLGKEIFAANVHQVLNILEILRITEIPNAAPYMKGVINLRGEVLSWPKVRYCVLEPSWMP